MIEGLLLKKKKKKWFLFWPTVTTKWCCFLLPYGVTAWGISGAKKSALWLVLLPWNPLVPPDQRINFSVKAEVLCYLAGDVRGHGRRRLGVGVGVLGHEARVVGGDAAEPMRSCRGHLEDAVDRISHQYITRNIYGGFIMTKMKKSHLHFIFMFAFTGS